MIFFGTFYWDPNPEIFRIPLLGLPILWYGLLFATGFIISFPILVGILERFFLCRPEFKEEEIIGECKDPRFLGAAKKGKGPLVCALNEWLISDQVEETSITRWKARFVSRSPYPQQTLKRLKLEQLMPNEILSLHKQALFLTDRLTVYIVLATIIGARLGHYLFYESPSTYLKNPWEIAQIWRGGLASHGALIAIVIALWLFMIQYKSKVRQLSWLHLLDFVSVPAALAGAFIRLGNFFNQEILGTVSNVPWAVIFGHPADHSFSVPRHPVQLYEACFYAAVFVLLWRLSFHFKYLIRSGKFLGIFLTLVFGFRFFIESWKEEQSQLLSSSLTMGQILSIFPFLIGLVLLWKSRSKW